MITEKEIDKMEVKVNVYQRLAKLRADKRLEGLKQSGKNNFAKFSYFELKDFLPIVNKLEEEYGLASLFTLYKGVARLEVVNIDQPVDYVLFETEEKDIGQAKMAEIQQAGAKHTYLKRFLMYNYLNLTDGEVVDALDNTGNNAKQPKIQSKPQNKVIKITSDQVNQIRMLYQPEELAEKVLPYYKVKEVEDLNIEQASQAISNRKNK